MPCCRRRERLALLPIPANPPSPIDRRLVRDVMTFPGQTIDAHGWQVERRSDGAVLVRVPSCEREGRQLPDAVFAFRCGDPQFGYWEQRLREQEVAHG